MRPLFNVLYVSAEINPLAKVGGLADIGAALPVALRRRGHDVRVVMPRYSSINLVDVERILPSGQFDVPMMGGSEKITVSQTSLNDGTPVYLLCNSRYFDRPNVYMEEDDLERFLLFSIATAYLPSVLDWRPDIFHCHDWHAGLIPPLRAMMRLDAPADPLDASLFTIHNIAYQGSFDEWFSERAGLGAYLLAKSDPLGSKVMSLMGLGVLHADVISTVSITHARELLTPEYGAGLELVLQRRKTDLFGIVNGVDHSEFNPSTDIHIPARYDVDSLARKAENKTALQSRFDLSSDPGIPLVGMVGRLVPQKGLDLAAEALGLLLDETDIQFVNLGSGNEEYHVTLEKLSADFPGRVHAFFAFDPSLARLVYAGCDLFLMPSRYEPCGLGQMIAMRYGTIPVVRHTGGLADTVEDCNSDLSSGTGFVFYGYDTQELIDAVKRGLEAFGTKEAWRGIMARAMQVDFSWDMAARKYESLYKKALEKASSTRDF